MENQSTYRIRTKLGETNPINIPISLMQEYNSFEILSLKINTDDTYRSYTSTEGIVIGRVSTQNNGLGIPNVRVSIFVPKGEYEQTDEEEVLYPFSSPTDLDGDRIRYNLLPSESDVDCYQVIGTLPPKRKMLDNETVCEVFEKYYKYTTVTNEAGDFMLSNIPVGQQRLHIDCDLSDIGPFLSQRPYDMIENLGFEKTKFESNRQFKTSNDLDSLAQVISQNKSVYVYPYWGDATENNGEMKITRTDLSLNYEFKTNAIFIGSVITDKQSNGLWHNCTASENMGKMSDMITGPGRIEMIRKTTTGKVEQYRIKGDDLINDNGVWCYMVPMNLDYVRTDEYGNIIPTDDPNKGVPTRARVRFRVTLNETDSDEDRYKRCSYLVPNNPQFDDEKFIEENDADYSFGSSTWDESFVDLFWNKVYTVKNYIPRLQKTTRPTNKKHTGIKGVNYFGDNNPFPFNSMTIKLPFQYRLICVLIKVFINLISFVNNAISAVGFLPCWIGALIGGTSIVRKMGIKCVAINSEFCDDGVSKVQTYPGCFGCVWKKITKKQCQKEQVKKRNNGEEEATCTRDAKNDGLYTCIEQQLAQSNEATSFNFGNDWINGCLYMPLWYRRIRPKKTFLFGIFSKPAKDNWCAGENNNAGRALKVATFCSPKNSGRTTNTVDYNGDKIIYHYTTAKDKCDKKNSKCHNLLNYFPLTNGVIMNKENMLGQKVWYYKAVESVSVNGTEIASEYLDVESNARVSKTLFATDVILLGSMSDCDLNGVPKFYNYLRGSTYNMPNDILFTDTEYEYILDENGEIEDQEVHQTSISSGADWGNKNEYNEYDGGLFYSIGCNSDSIKVDTPSCINLRRICELGVGQDEVRYIEDLTQPINSENDTLDYDSNDNYLRPDGFVSYDDIIDFNYRSMFATMNGNRLKTKINTTNGVREYDMRHLYIGNFDGSLRGFMEEEQTKKSEEVNYRYNYKLEEVSTDYLTFRMGDRPYYYDGENLVNGAYNTELRKYSLPKYQNSFYFYFGLKEGKTAIDLFNENYNAKCGTEITEDETIPYIAAPNCWCLKSGNKDYTNSTNDGYLKINFDSISLPCTAVLSSKSNAAITYTIVNEDGDTAISDEKVCFYGELSEDANEKMDSYTRYYFHYENPSVVDDDGNTVDVEKCYVLSNGNYIMYLTDGDGDQHAYEINFQANTITADNVVNKFTSSNTSLLSKYMNYDSVARSPLPTKDHITITCDTSGVPSVERVDNDKSTLKRKTDLSVNLNGTICLYNIKCGDNEVSKYLIEVESYYEDEDLSDWYKVGTFNDSDNDKYNLAYQYKTGTYIQGEESSKAPSGYEFIELDTPYMYETKVISYSEDGTAIEKTVYTEWRAVLDEETQKIKIEETSYDGLPEYFYYGPMLFDGLIVTPQEVGANNGLIDGVDDDGSGDESDEEALKARDKREGEGNSNGGDDSGSDDSEDIEGPNTNQNQPQIEQYNVVKMFHFDGNQIIQLKDDINQDKSNYTAPDGYMAITKDTVYVYKDKDDKIYKIKISFNQESRTVTINNVNRTLKDYPTTSVTYIFEGIETKYDIDDGLNHDEIVYNGSDEYYRILPSNFYVEYDSIIIPFTYLTETIIVPIENSNSQYFSYKEVVVNSSSNWTVKCNVVKCPKGNVTYRVRITEVCYNEDGKYYHKTDNYTELKVYVEEATPYKLYINGVDYDMIKNFKTGWELSHAAGMQTANACGKSDYKPFEKKIKGCNFSEIKGWLNFSDANNKVYSWETNVKKYGTADMTFEKYNNGNYKCLQDYNNAVSRLENGGDVEANQKTIDELGPTVEILNNRLEFINQMQKAFWLMDENIEKQIVYTVKTDAVPYDVWTLYNDEVVSDTDFDYNEAESEDNKDKRHYWKYTGESTRYINGIKIPNITSYDSTDFGIANDSVRKGEADRRTFGYVDSDGKAHAANEKGYDPGEYQILCYAQDNIASSHDSVNMKPPYMVACVNNDAETKPEGLSIKTFFSKQSPNKYGISPYKFGSGSSGYISRNDVEFFQFMLIDKIFQPDIVCWSYIKNIPKFYANATYEQGKAGEIVTIEGILSGFIKNGITTNNTEDFGEKSIFGFNVNLATRSGDDENSIPTRRCILSENNFFYVAFNDNGDIALQQATTQDGYSYGNVKLPDKSYIEIKTTETNEETGETTTITQYKLYYYDNTNVELVSEGISDVIPDGYEKLTSKYYYRELYKLKYHNYTHCACPSQYQHVMVPNTIGDLEFEDSNGVTTSRTLYGSMRIELNPDTVNGAHVAHTYTYTYSDGSTQILYYDMQNNDDTSLTLKVNAINVDSDETITYYLFDGTKHVYPINSFYIDNETNEYNVDCTTANWTWTYTVSGVTHNVEPFSKNTTESDFEKLIERTKYDTDSHGYWNNGIPAYRTEANSQILNGEDEDGNPTYDVTYGYGTTGVFEHLNHRPYFVVATTPSGCRAISPMYDFTSVYYEMGLVDDKYLRIRLSSVINSTTKNVKNYYLAFYDFSVDWNVIFDDEREISSSVISYHVADSTSEQPYCMQYKDSEIDQTTYKALQTLFGNSTKNIMGSFTLYVTDITGLRHVGVLSRIIKDSNEWN